MPQGLEGQNQTKMNNIRRKRRKFRTNIINFWNITKPKIACENLDQSGISEKENRMSRKTFHEYSLDPDFFFKAK